MSGVATATRRIMPLLLLCLFVNVIDRSNVGIAALRMRAEIGLSASAYGVGAGIFYIGFFFGGVPSNLMLHRIGARRWLCAIMTGWGIAASSTALVHDAWSFYVVRFLLGVTEAGFIPAIVYYLGHWFDRRVNSRMMGLLIGLMPISVAIGAPLGVGLLVSVGWRWLFLIEGVPAVLLAFVVLRALPDSIERASWLSPAQRAELAGHLEIDDALREPPSWRAALAHPQVPLLALQYFCIQLGGQALAFWLPQVLGSTGLSGIASGILSGLPWLLSGLLTPLWSIHSERNDERYWHAILPCIAAGMALIAGGASLASPVAAVLLLSLGIALSSMAVAAYWSIPRVYVTGAAAAASGALVNSFGNLAGFVGPAAVGFASERFGGFGQIIIILACPLFVAAIVSAMVGRMADPRQPAPERVLGH